MHNPGVRQLFLIRNGNLEAKKWKSTMIPYFYVILRYGKLYHKPSQRLNYNLGKIFTMLLTNTTYSIKK